MKSKYKYLASAALSGLFGLLVSFSASAQRHGGGGGGGSHGGGGGFHGGGGGGYHASGGGGGYHGSSGGSFNRGGGGGSYSRPQGSYSRPQGSSRPQGNYAPQRGSSVQGYRGNAGGSRLSVNGRGGGSIAPQRGYAYSNRGGIGYRGGVGVGRGGGSFAPRGAYRGGSFHGSFYHGRYQSYNRFYGHYGYYNRFYGPRLGFHVGFLPYGYIPFYWGDYEYYYSNGYYYNYDNNNYTIVEPPVGAIMDQVPAGAKSIMIDGEQYYELNGVYYQAVTKDDGSTGYQIAGKDGELTTGAGAAPQDNGGAYDQQDNSAPQQNNAPVADNAPIRIGDVFDALPANTNTVKIDGQKYFVSPDGIYYQETTQNGRRVYRVAGTPEDQPGN